MRTCVVLLLTALSYSLYAQNVGIGIEEPTATLHLENVVSSEQELQENFNFGYLNPSYLTGSHSWYLQSGPEALGLYSARAPQIILPTTGAGLNIPFFIPKDKIAVISFSYKAVYNANFTFTYQSNTIPSTILPESSSWSVIEKTFYGTGLSDTLFINFLPTENITAPEIYIDNIQINYEDGHGLRIKDGTEGESYLLVSDELGNAQWKDIWPTISDSINTAKQNLSITSSHRLSISDGNEVDIPALRAGGHKLIIGSNSTAKWGFNNSVDNIYGTAWGINNNVQAFYGTSWGELNEVSGTYATAWGKRDTAIGAFSTVWGEENRGEGWHSTLWGKGNLAQGSFSTAWGWNNYSSGQGASVWGQENTSIGIAATSWGHNNYANGAQATAFGSGTLATASKASAWGSNSLASGSSSTAFGISTKATGNNSTAIGIGTIANSYSQMSIGRFNDTLTNVSASAWQEQDHLFVVGIGLSDLSRKNAFELWKNGNAKIGHLNMTVSGTKLNWGLNNNTTASYSSAWGVNNTASGLNSTSWGNLNNASGDNSTAWGYNNTASNDKSTTWGHGNKSTGAESTSWGRGTIANSYLQTSLGQYNDTLTTVYPGSWISSNQLFVIGNGSSNNNRKNAFELLKNGDTKFGHFQLVVSGFKLKWGLNNVISSTYSTAWGKDNTAGSSLSTTWGSQNSTTNLRSTAWGEQNLASGENSTVWGQDNTSSGTGATAFGRSTEAKGHYSSTSGRNTTAEAYAQTSLGRYNLLNSSANSSLWSGSDPVFVIGNGSSAANRNNALTVIQSGNTGIGISTPTEALQVAGKIQSVHPAGQQSHMGVFELWNGNLYGFEFEYDGSTDLMHLWSRGFSGNEGKRMTFKKNGNVGIKDEDPTYDFELPNSSVDGTARAFSWTTYSDERVKKNVLDLEVGLKEIMQLRPKSYDHHTADFKNGQLQLLAESEATMGLLAQEVFEVIPEIVFQPEDEQTDLWSLDYEKLIPVLVKAIQEQEAERVSLEERIAVLEKLVTKLVEEQVENLAEIKEEVESQRR